MIEREIKLRLTAGNYRTLRRVLKPVLRSESVQVNYYFDTRDGRLGAARAGLRLRREGNRRWITYKKAFPRESAAHVHGEWERGVSQRLWVSILRNPGRLNRLETLPCRMLRRDFGPVPLQRRGTLRNHRSVYLARLAKGSPALRLELDRTRFPGGVTDFELEVEIGARRQRAAESLLRRLLKDCVIPWRPQTRGKLHRLSDILGKGGRI